MSITAIQNARLLLPDGRIEAGTISFGERILADAPPGAPSFDARGALVTPGLIDVHCHGVGNHAFERSPEDLRAGLDLLPQSGVTTVLPTLYQSLKPESFSLLDQLAAQLDSTAGARAPGFHLEGPFLAIAGAGAITRDGDVALLGDLVAACRRRVAAMSVSPEVKGIVPVIERLVELGIVPFITHTGASDEQTQAAIDAGARHATHFYDVFPVPPQTEAGVRPVGAVETLLADPRATVDFICDGVHVHPTAIRAALAAKGDAGVIAITDSNVGAGLGEGLYDTPWGYRVRVRPGDAARIGDPDHPHAGSIAGSSLTMNQAVANLRTWLSGRPASVPWMMATRNPARMLGLQDVGTICPNAAADLVAWSEGEDGRLTPRAVWIGGHRIPGVGED